MRIVFTALSMGLTALVLWILIRALATGVMPINERLARRSSDPVWYWLGIAVACALLFLVGRGLFSILFQA